MSIVCEFSVLDVEVGVVRVLLISISFFVIFLLLCLGGGSLDRLSRSFLDLRDVSSVVEINFDSVGILGVRLLLCLLQPLDEGSGLVMDLLCRLFRHVLLGNLKIK